MRATCSRQPNEGRQQVGPTTHPPSMAIAKAAPPVVFFRFAFMEPPSGRRVSAVLRHVTAHPCLSRASLEPCDLPRYHPALPSPLDDTERFPTEQDAVAAVIEAEKSRTYHLLLEEYYERYGKGGNFWVPRMFVQRGVDKHSNKVRESACLLSGC